MKKILLASLLFIGVAQLAQAQLQVGLKAGVNYNSDSFNNVSNDVLNGAESRTGYHAGIWFRAKLPIVGLYLRPEIVYTELSNDITYDNTFATAKTTDYKFRKIDVPVLLGKKIFGIGNIFAGPSFQYILSSDFGFDDLREVSTDQFSLGIQLGGGIEFGRLGIDVRWERGLSKNETKFVDDSISSEVNFDTRVSQIIFGVSYRL
ncbi:MAG: porin family protein [Flavobacteriaceae bacterium]